MRSYKLLLAENEQFKKINNSLVEALNKYDDAAKKFINKVETGVAFSKETYADLKNCLWLSLMTKRMSPQQYEQSFAKEYMGVWVGNPDNKE